MATKTWADLGIEVPAHANSGEVDTLCPWCSHTRKKKTAKCLSVNLDTGAYFCHHCGVSGGLNQQHRQAAQLHWRKPIYSKPFERAIPEELNAGMVQFLAARGITPDVMRRNRLSVARVYMPQLEDHVSAIRFPYYRGEQLVNAKYRDREKNFRLEPGAERILYGLNDIDFACCTIVEGEIDKLSVEVAGIVSCVSVPDGAPDPNTKHYDSKFTFLNDDRVAAVRRWNIAVDNDAPGQRLEQELVRRLSIAKCRRVSWPEGCKDANDVLVKHGAERLRVCIEHAKDYPISGVLHVSQLWREIAALYHRTISPGISTGWPPLDEYYTVQAGEVSVVTGTPGSGKSEWLDALCVNLARDHQWVIPMFSPENSPVARHASRLIEKFNCQPFRDGPTPRMSPERMKEALEWVDFYFPMIAPPDSDDWTLASVLDIARKLILREGARGIVIDPWNELEDTCPPGMNESHFIGKQLRLIRNFARQTLVHVWIVAHPAKMYRNKEGVYAIPTPYDIAGSANFFNKPDNCLCVYRDKGDGRQTSVKLLIQKIRSRDTGKCGEVCFTYNRVLGIFEAEVKLSIVRDEWSTPQEPRSPPE